LRLACLPGEARGKREVQARPKHEEDCQSQSANQSACALRLGFDLSVGGPLACYCSQSIASVRTPARISRVIRHPRTAARRSTATDAISEAFRTGRRIDRSVIAFILFRRYHCLVSVRRSSCRWGQWPRVLWFSTEAFMSKSRGRELNPSYTPVRSVHSRQFGGWLCLALCKKSRHPAPGRRLEAPYRNPRSSGFMRPS